ncbi:MAG: ABC transporter ATP-binding protein [Halanaeroarchaeum sp.]
MTDANRPGRGTDGGSDRPTDHSRTAPLLSVEGLEKHYPITEGWLRRETGSIRAVDGVSFGIERGETFGLVGESGSGKSTTAETILGLESPTAGTIRFDGDDVATLDDGARQAFRRRVQLVVQDPNEAFSPRMTIGEAVAEPLLLNGLDDDRRRREIVTDILERVGLSADDADRYPHEFSGGEKQRIAIARALVLNPDLIVADEPTSALDNRVESDVLALLDRIRREYDVAILFISHDIDVVRRFCDRVGVLYLGEIVERGPTADVLDSPSHPYTRMLLDSVPSLDPADRTLARPLTDVVPDPSNPPTGCPFHTRCSEIVPPDDVDVPGEHWQAVAAFQFTLQVGELPAAVDGDAGNESVDETVVRDAFDLPAELSDPSLERVVSTAIDDLLQRDREAAVNTLDDHLSTVCSRRDPISIDDGDRSVQCHRYDPDVDAEPLPWSGDRS